MKCPRCRKSDLKVTKTHPDGKATYDETIVRRRKCKTCGHAFTTYETIDAKTSDPDANIADPTIDLLN